MDKHQLRPPKALLIILMSSHTIKSSIPVSIYSIAYRLMGFNIFMSTHRKITIWYQFWLFPAADFNSQSMLFSILFVRTICLRMI